MNFGEYLSKILKEINITIKEEEINKFLEYERLLLEWNSKFNLTAITDEKEIIIKHFVDSLTINKFINKNEEIVDIGTGAGFPSIPLAIMNENCSFTLVDSLNKRISFLEEVKNKLNFKNVKTIHSRAEDFGRNEKNRETYDKAVARAVASMKVLVEYLLPTIKIGGTAICMKGNEIDEELEEAKFAINKLGGKIKEVEQFILPDTDFKRNIVIIEKVKNTPSAYPRRAGIPYKDPLFFVEQ